jgi:hypothetical protein
MALGSTQPNRNEYHVHFLGGRCVRLTNLPPSCAVVMKSGNLNFLEPSGPLHSCNGTALPFTEGPGDRGQYCGKKRFETRCGSCDRFECVYAHWSYVVKV